jgi:hypothetical protein
MKDETISRVMRKVGSLGGKKTVSKYGAGHMSELGKKSAARKKELRDKATKSA